MNEQDTIESLRAEVETAAILLSAVVGRTPLGQRILPLPELHPHYREAGGRFLRRTGLDGCGRRRSFEDPLYVGPGKDKP